MAAAGRQRLSGWPRGSLAAALALVLIASGGAWFALKPYLGWGEGQFGAVRSSAPPLPKVEASRLLDLPPSKAQAVNAASPIVPGKRVAATPFAFSGGAEALARAVDCLAAAAWYEAGDDPVGQRSVVQVVLNRARHPAFPRSVCGVVFQGSNRSTGCQFTFTCDGALRRTPSPPAWARARFIAAAALSGSVYPDVGYATHYHTDWVVPYWSRSLDKIAQVKTHIFYLWQGYWGRPSAFGSGTVQDEPFVEKMVRLSLAHLTAGPGEGPAVLKGGLNAAGAQGSAAAPSLPTPITVEGVAEAELRRALVRSRSGGGDQFFIQLDPHTFAGSYATAAIALCRGRTRCQVLGWRDAEQVATGLPLSDAQATTLSFYYLRSGESESALWNCQQVERRNSAQCLPETSGARAALLL